MAKPKTSSAPRPVPPIPATPKPEPIVHSGKVDQSKTASQRGWSDTGKF